MPQDVEAKIKMLEDIRKDIAEGAYLNPIKAQRHIIFLLALLDELTDALFKINDAITEAAKHDPNVNPGNKQGTGPLPS